MKKHVIGLMLAAFALHASAVVIQGELPDGSYKNFAVDSSGALAIGGGTGGTGPSTGTGAGQPVSFSTLISTTNSSVTPLGISGVFTGTSEEVVNFGEVRVSIFSDQASATDGLQMQQSNNATNWDNVDTYSIPAATGKTFGSGISSRYFRIVYTNGGVAQAAFRLQTTYHYIPTKPSAIRPQDGRTNDNDFEEQNAYMSVFNGTTWDRARGTAAGGQFTQGPAAEAATAAGNPILSGGRVRNVNVTLTNAVAAANTITTNGAVVNRQFAIPELDWSYAALTGGIINTTDVTVKAAAGAGLRNYVTGLNCTNAAAAVATEVVLKDGATVIWRGYLGLVAQGSAMIAVAFPTPLKSTANTALNVAAITTAAAVYCNLQGYTAP